MKNGDKVKCPHCGQETLVKEKNLMSGWTSLGKALVCALCGEKLGEPEAEGQSKDNKAALDSLKSLLQTDDIARPVIEVAADEKNFCKDCANFIEHPFETRCGLHRRPTGAMDDCPQFTPKKKENKHV